MIIENTNAVDECGQTEQLFDSLRPRAIVHPGHPRHLGALVLTIYQTPMK